MLKDFSAIFSPRWTKMKNTIDFWLQTLKEYNQGIPVKPQLLYWQKNTVYNSEDINDYSMTLVEFTLLSGQSNEDRESDD